MSNETTDRFFREYIIDYCSRCILNELQNKREDWDLDYLCHYVLLKGYVLSDENATVKSILDYMKNFESNENILIHARMAFRNFLENMTSEDLTDLLRKMDEALK